MTNMKNLKELLIGDGGQVVRYKNYVVAVEFAVSPRCEFFQVTVCQPIETEEETGLDFQELRLEIILNGWESKGCDTDGEALMVGFQFIENL